MASRFPTPRISKSKARRPAAVAPPRSREPKAEVCIFDDAMVAQFYQVCCSYADDLLRLMEMHVVKSLRDEELTPSMPEYDDLYKRTWRLVLKHCRGWNRKLVDEEVTRILKSMAGLVADVDSDSDSEDEDTSATSPELASYRSTLETYMEYARWVYMSSLTDSDADPVDDIPTVQLSDFVNYFVTTLTRQRAVKTGMFLTYDESNRAQVIRPCIVEALRRTIPERVYNGLIKSRLAQAQHKYRSRRHSLSSGSSTPQRRPIVRSRMLNSSMMSSRSVAERIRTKPQPLVTSASDVLAAKRQAAARAATPNLEMVDSEPASATISTADVPVANVDGPEGEGAVIAVNLDRSMRTDDFRSESEHVDDAE